MKKFSHFLDKNPKQSINENKERERQIALKKFKNNLSQMYNSMSNLSDLWDEIQTDIDSFSTDKNSLDAQISQKYPKSFNASFDELVSEVKVWLMHVNSIRK